MKLSPITLKEASAYITEHHRHCVAPRGWKFGISLRSADGDVHGVVVVGRPIARLLDDGQTAEITRLCTDGTKNACSMLYSAARRAAFAMGYRRIITYTLATETGASLRASGFTNTAITEAYTWNRSRRLRPNSLPICPKVRWESQV